MKILSIDHGTKKIGLAVSDELGITARPLSVIYIKNKNQATDKIIDIIKSQNCQKVLIGIPFGYGGEDSLQTKIVKEFARDLKKNIDIEIVFWDESYSSKEAISNLCGRTRRDIDSESAKIILLEYLNSFSL